MSHESDAERISLAANTRILNLQNLTLDDVRTFIRQQHEVAVIFTEIYPNVPLLKKVEGGFQKALDLWDEDKSEAIISVLTLMNSMARMGQRECVEACVRCVYIVAENPLFPTADPEAYGSLLRSAYKNFEIAMEDPKIPEHLKNVVLAKLTIINYSTLKFCPAASGNVLPNSVGVDFPYLAGVINLIADQPPAM